MPHPIFWQYFAVLVPLILLPVLAFYYLHKKKSIVYRNAKDVGTGASNSSTTPTETNSEAPLTSTAHVEAVATLENYHVFLSFRGRDTRTGFTDHLFRKLKSYGIDVFRDNENLRHGKQIGPDLFAAINNSTILIPILSMNYGSSRWCLDELVHMMKCIDKDRHMVLPIFYKVEPTHVRNQTGSFGKAFRWRFEPSKILVVEFWRLISYAFYVKSMREFWRSFESTILNEWKEALTEVSKLKGWEVKGYEGELVQQIAQVVLSTLKLQHQLVMPENLVGIDSHVEKIMKFINDNSGATLFVGIHGMGGIGKTTLAKTIYNKLSKNFQYHSFIADIKDSCGRNGLEYLQNQLIFDISRQKNQVYNKDEGTKFISSMFQHKKVLILLDDVDDDNQLKALVGNCNWFSSKSRIIITTRNKTILDNAKVDYNYKLEEMAKNHSLILFSKHAFKSDYPPSEFEDLTHDVVSTTGGLPLSLEVLGSFLYRKEPMVWIDMINKSRKVPHPKVQEKLRISYEALEYRQKQIFLDISCFFIGTDKRKASYMWDACDFFPEEGIEVLRVLSLIKVGDNNELIMHDQLRDLGREIVREENQEEPRYRSRLWDSKEVLKVLEGNEGTGKIKAIYLSEGSSEGSGKIADQGYDIETNNEFKNLKNLRFLHVSATHFCGVSKNSFEELRWLRWRNCPLTFKANNTYLKELIVLDLSRSKISDKWQGWSSIMMAEKLKFLDLTRCHSLKGTFFLSAFKNLEVLILRDCEEVEKIDSSIGDMKCLEILNISGTGIKEISNDIGRLIKLRDLDASRCKRLGGEVPDSIRNLSSLERLDFYNCRHLQSLPKLPSSLIYLRVTCQKLPSLSNLTHLKELRLIACKFLKCIPKLPSTLLELSNCSQLTNVEESELPESLNTPFKLEILKIICCDFMETLDVSQLNHLKTLSAEYCDNILEVRGLDKLKYLESLTVKGCDSIERLDLPKSKTLKLYVQDCKNLVKNSRLR